MRFRKVAYSSQRFFRFKRFQQAVEGLDTCLIVNTKNWFQLQAELKKGNLIINDKQLTNNTINITKKLSEIATLCDSSVTHFLVKYLGHLKMWYLTKQ